MGGAYDGSLPARDRSGLRLARSPTTLPDAPRGEIDRLWNMIFYLESGVELEPAIALYEGLGFIHLSPERRPWSPYARVSVWMERVLQR